MTQVNRELLSLSSAIANMIDDAFNGGQKTVGFGLILFEFDKATEPGNLYFVSNAQRGQMAVSLKELAARLEGRMVDEPGHC